MCGWLKRLFGFGKKEITINHPIHTDEIKEEPAKKEEEEIVTPEVSGNNAVVNKPTFVAFTDEDKENILNVLRPLVKSLNTDVMYEDFCKNILMAGCKRLKTFCKMSDDHKTMSIYLTQSSNFNSSITDFISDHVAAIFKVTIDTELVGKYDVEAKDGIINIRKIG